MSDWFKKNNPDLAMMAITFVWGFHYIVLKDGFTHLPPLAFNALRFSVALPFLALIAWRFSPMMRMKGRDFWRMVRIVVVGPALFQMLFVIGLDYTTSTNSALVNATMPAWVAVFSMALGRIHPHKLLMLGLVVTLSGVSLVVLGGDEAHVHLSRNDIIGSGISLIAAIVLGLYTVRIKPILDAYGSLGVGIWTHFIVWIALTLVSLPDLVALTPSDLPADVWPSLLYSGLLAAAFGRMTYNYGIKRLGSTRASAYQNFTPMIAAFSAALLLGESLTPVLLMGALLTLYGVTMVRRHSLPIKHPPAIVPQPSLAGAD